MRFADLATEMTFILSGAFVDAIFSRTESIFDDIFSSCFNISRQKTATAESKLSWNRKSPLLKAIRRNIIIPVNFSISSPEFFFLVTMFKNEKKPALLN